MTMRAFYCMQSTRLLVKKSIAFKLLLAVTIRSWTDLMFLPISSKKALPLSPKHVVSLILMASLIAGISLPAVAQQETRSEKTVHLLQEPRHRTVMQDGGVFLLDVQLNAGDSSFAHTHNQAILLTYISDENGARHGEVVARTEYAGKPLTHVVENPGPNMIHIMAMVNDNPPVPADFEDVPSGLNEEPQIENRWFRSYRLELQPGESTQLLTHQNPVAIILGEGELLHVTRADGITNELDRPGDWAWRAAGSGYQVSNMGDVPCAVLINESRRRGN